MLSIVRIGITDHAPAVHAGTAYTTIWEGPVGLNGVDLNLLPALHALLTERNVTRAAERMSVVQSSMSFSLKKLRRHFDDELLVPEGRQLVLTPLAESLVQPVARAVARAEEVLSVTSSFDAATSARSFTVLTSDYVTTVLISQLLTLFATEAPQVRINITPMQPDYIEQLRSGQADLLIMPTVFAEGQPWFPHQALFRDRFVLAADRDNPHLGEEVTREQFARLPYLAYTAPGELPSLVDTQLDAVDVARRVVASVPNFLSIPRLLPGTPLVSILHERFAVQQSTGRLRLLPPPVPMDPITEAMYWNPRHESDPAHAWLRSRIAQVAERL